MPITTDYSLFHDPGFEGQRVDLQLTNVFTKSCELAAGINEGRAVVQGTADGQATLPSATGQELLGFTNLTSAGQATGTDVHLYQQYKSMNVTNVGPMWLFTENSVTPGDKVYFRHTALGGNTVIGRVRSDADTNTCDQIEGATFRTTTAAGEMAIVWLGGLKSNLQTFESITAIAAGALSLVTDVSQFDTTLGAATSTLADGTEGQIKYLEMIVDGGDMVVTPANLFNGTTLTFDDVGDLITLIFVNTDWHVISNSIGAIGPFIDPTVDTHVALAGAISILTSTTLIDTTAGATTATLADGQIGQIKRLKMITDGGALIVTPANLTGGTTLTFNRVGQVIVLQFHGTEWLVISNEGVVGLDLDLIVIDPATVQTITVNGAEATSLVTYSTFFDTTLGAQTSTIADGEEGQKKFLKMTIDGGTDMVVTPANFFDGATMTFADILDSCELMFISGAWTVISNTGMVIA